MARHFLAIPASWNYRFVVGFGSQHPNNIDYPLFVGYSTTLPLTAIMVIVVLRLPHGQRLYLQGNDKRL
jgi:hypothetical protein